MTTTPEFCSHPELRPTAWNQKRPARAKMTKCRCGANAICHICGWGRGRYPCDCDRVGNGET